MIEKIQVYKVANGYVVQIKCVGISVETTFIVQELEELGQSIDKFINRVLEEKV